MENQIKLIQRYAKLLNISDDEAGMMWCSTGMAKVYRRLES